MSWTTALKEYAKATGKFVVPKKGTPEYEAVVKIQNKLKGIPDPEEVKAEKAKKERKKKEEAMPKPPTEEEIKKKAEEERIRKEEADKKAIEDAINAKKAKQAEKRALAKKLKEEHVALQKQVAESNAKRDKIGAEVATMKALAIAKPSKEELDAHAELSAKKKAERAEKRKEKKLKAIEEEPKTSKRSREPSFRIEDKQIIISFKE